MKHLLENKQTVYLPADGKSCDFIVRWYDDSYENDVKREEGYFFTPEQLNELLSDVIKDALNTAAINAEIEDCGNPYDSNDNSKTVSEKSITETFKQTFQKHKV